MTMLIMANRFDTCKAAYERYRNFLVPEYCAICMDWGFGKWLWLDYCAAELPRLEYWKLLKTIGILTADGRKRLAKAQKAKG